MLSDIFCERISEDRRWRESELRQIDSRLLRFRGAVDYKSAIVLGYSHWEGHFKFSALTLFDFVVDCINRKICGWTDLKLGVRQRILFCSYRRQNPSSQDIARFISHLNFLSAPEFSQVLSVKEQITSVDSNLSTARAEEICRNFGMEADWCTLKKVIIDNRLLEHRNAIAHGSQRLRSGDIIDLDIDSVNELFAETKGLIRETSNRFENAVTLKEFLSFR